MATDEATKIIGRYHNQVVEDIEHTANTDRERGFLVCKGKNLRIIPTKSNNELRMIMPQCKPTEERILSFHTHPDSPNASRHDFENAKGNLEKYMCIGFKSILTEKRIVSCYNVKESGSRLMWRKGI